ncbi:transcriptional regulator MraZ [Candidatus Phycosocius bacilliformis]|uniref:Transcriptional regulator MraZ n=1 Tax=Candidatus Phycosocius bacilliformis TaxID=1445552 RepID=A0A2P2EC93_9PROT|nr:division/cell wall cluster transcriptional repressor MraZ [Candidatus Phycosocius bacilliformis]GBF58678.1 transcriptional regulator MraZ [Candidatus Phycosocius bacilliformis]
MRFVSTYDAGLDEKRRVTLPADFRSSLRSGRDGADHIRVWPGDGGWLEAADDDFIAALSQSAEDLAQDDPEAAEAATLAILGGSRKLALDGAGRIVLPEAFVAHATLGDRVSFIGLGPYFRIATPEIAASMAHAARDRTAPTKARIFAMARRKVREGGAG